MGHVEGFDAEAEGDLVNFIKRLKEIWQNEKSRTKGAPSRYGLTIGVNNRRAIFEPTVTTGKGVKTLIIWNLKTEDTNKIREETNKIGLPAVECPYLWPEIPPILPKEKTL